ncbi:naringenin 8-dimethylallyltransferase 1, chloroplastic-like isoform X1 [Cajanus cajan]|uniref:naringenin 8-dimethylallyltransferase 1, chloroplastic-like isoform X1 n=1 Tax=Cajanus cajan TaxID=3821 RepID=UPI00098D8423|nr:naringenin 8-dimethylallyltransferase 1, chloroplastic-like isoform X1 [Cajanus cajan]
MASMLLGSFSLASSLTAGSYVTKASWYKTKKIQNEYLIIRHQQQHNLKHHYRCIEAASTSKERGRSYSVTAASGESFEYEHQDPRPKSLLVSTKDSLNTFFRFTRPVGMIATAINIISGSLLAVENLSDISPTFFIGLLKAMAVILPMHIYNVGLNTLTDFEIDKINKPNLPMASGEYSLGTVTIIVASSLILSFGLGWIVGSLPLLWVISFNFIFSSAYSMKLPLLRWKRSSVLTAINYIVDRGIMFNLGLFLHMKTYVFKRSTMYPRSLIFAIVFMSIFGIVIALFKDIPDIEGDEKFGIRTLAVCLGPKWVFWFCISLLEMAYGAAILFVGATSSFLWSKLITGLGHAFLASILWYHAKSVDVKSKEETFSFYILIWKMLMAECFILPFVR